MAEFSFEDLFKEVDTLTDKEQFTELFPIDEVLMITPKAALLKFENGEEKWVPKSVLRVDEDAKLWVINWFYKKEF